MRDWNRNILNDIACNMGMGYIEDRTDVSEEVAEQQVIDAIKKDNKLHANTKRAWLKRLRSGDYTQCSGMLKERPFSEYSGSYDEPAYCCLGVLAEQKGDLKHRRHRVASWMYDVDGQYEDRWYHKGNDNESMPPHGYAGIAYSVMQSLAEANDSGATFNEIADFIEKYL